MESGGTEEDAILNCCKHHWVYKKNKKTSKPTTTMSPGVTNQRKGGNWHPSIVHPRTSTNQPNSFQKPYRS
jgi:hypothetical protein